MAMYNGHMIQVSATEYKHNALKLLEQVRISGEVIQITKRGKPVAQLVRVDDLKPQRVFGQFHGEVKIVGDIVGPIVDPEEWGDLT
jgi:prevent-host-death family protein